MKIFTMFALALASLVPISGSAQNIFTEGIRANLPTVRFSYENPQMNPSTYEISVDAVGDAEYISRDSGGKDVASNAEPQPRQFQMSKATRDRIFSLTRSLRNFRGDYEYRKHKVAFSGKKRFTYIEGAEEHSTEFNWSENKDITELAELFQGIASTLQGEQKLLYLQKYDKLGLNAALATLEQQANRGWLREIGVISKVLNEIATDRGVMTLARQRAERLLKLADENRKI